MKENLTVRLLNFAKECVRSINVVQSRRNLVRSRGLSAFDDRHHYKPVQGRWVLAYLGIMDRAGSVLLQVVGGDDDNDDAHKPRSANNYMQLNRSGP